jgi:hypothetical protein
LSRQNRNQTEKKKEQKRNEGGQIERKQKNIIFFLNSFGNNFGVGVSHPRTAQVALATRL